MRAVLYCRVSSDEQRERQTIEGQLHDVRQHAAREGYEVVTEIKDDGISGDVPFHERPGSQRVLALAREGLVDVVLMLQADRLGRNSLEALLARDELKKLHVKLVFVHQQFDDTPEGRFQFLIFLGVAELEREHITRRMKTGHQRVVREGAYLASVVPFGYQRGVNGKLKIDKKQAEVVRTIYRLCREGSSLVEIAAQLDKTRLKSPGGAKWCSTAVYKLVVHARYRGAGTYRNWQYETEGYVDGKKKQRKVRVVESLPMHCPAIVSEKEWNEAQAALAERRRMKRGSTRPNRDYLLAKLVICPYCGKRCDATTARSGKTVYACRNRRINRKMSDVVEQHSGKWHWQGDVLEEQIERLVGGILEKPKRYLGLMYLREVDNGDLFSHEAQEARLRATLTELGDRESRIIDAWESGKLTKQQFGQRIDRVRKENEEAAGQLETLVKQPTPVEEQRRALQLVTNSQFSGRQTHRLKNGQPGWRDLVRGIVTEVLPQPDGSVRVKGRLSPDVLKCPPIRRQASCSAPRGRRRTGRRRA